MLNGVAAEWGKSFQISATQSKSDAEKYYAIRNYTKSLNTVFLSFPWCILLSLSISW